MTTRLLYGVMGSAGVVIACRAWGTLGWVRSPLNVESIFVLSGLLLLLLHGARTLENTVAWPASWRTQFRKLGRVASLVARALLRAVSPLLATLFSSQSLPGEPGYGHSWRHRFHHNPRPAPRDANTTASRAGTLADRGAAVGSVSPGVATRHARVRAPRWVFPIIIGLLTFAAFFRNISDYFLSDDFFLLKHAPAALERPASQFTTAGGDGFYRPIGYLFLGLLSTWAGADPKPWHIAGLILHAANGVLILLLASRLGLSRFAAVVAAAVFVVHGSRPEAVIWLAGRFDLLATFCVLVGLLAFLRSWHTLALLAMTLAILSKESAYAFPLLVTLLAYPRWKASIPYVLVASALVGFRFVLFHGIGGYGGDRFSVLSTCKALTLRLWAVLFFPINWSWAPGVALAIVTAVYVVALIWMFTVRIPLSRLLIPLGFTLLAALPALQQLLIGPDLQKSRLLYLPSVGFCLLIATAIDHLRPRQATAVAAGIIVFQLAALLHNSSAWSFASAKARETCVAAASGSLGAAKPPGSLNGVYFFTNGFRECVELEERRLK